MTITNSHDLFYRNADEARSLTFHRHNDPASAICGQQYNHQRQRIMHPVTMRLWKLNSGSRIKQIFVRIQERIDEQHYTIMNVGGADERPSYSYTIGLKHLIGRELLLSGVSGDIANSIIHQLAEDAKAGTPLEMATLDGITPPRFSIKDVPMVSEHTALSLWNHHFTTIEDNDILTAVMLADKENILPGEDGYDHDFVQLYMNVQESDFTLSSQEDKDALDETIYDHYRASE